MISLVSGVARAYFELLELDDQLAIAQTHPGFLRADSQTLLRPACRRPGLEPRGFPRQTRAAHGHGDHPGNRAPNRAQGKRNQHAPRSQPRPVARTSTLLAQELPVEIPVGLPSTSAGAAARRSRGRAASPRGQRGNRRGHWRLFPAHRPDDVLRRHEHRPRQTVEQRGEHLVSRRHAPPARCSPAAA